MFDNKNTLVYVLLAVVVFFLLSNKMKNHLTVVAT